MEHMGLVMELQGWDLKDILRKMGYSEDNGNKHGITMLMEDSCDMEC